MRNSRSNRGWRWVLGVSLVVNLSLAGLALGWFGSRPPAAVPAPAPPSRSVRMAPPSRQIPTNTPTSSAVVTNELPFRWAMIESTNFAVYVANLRSIGCPEPVLRDMLVEELEALCRRPVSAPVPGGFWEHGDTRHQALRSAERAERERERDCRAVFRSLLGADWPVREMRELEAVAFAQVLGDFLPEDQLDLAAGTIQRLEDESGWLRADVGGLTLPEDDEKQLALYRQWYDEVRAQVTPAAWEEILLRTAVFKDRVRHDLFRDLSLSGAEVREVFRALIDGTDPVFDAFAQSASLPEEYRGEAKPLEDPNRLEKIKQVLGPDRAVDLERNRDPAYEPIRNFVSRRGLSKDIGLRLYESRRLAEQTARLLADSTDLSDEDRRGHLQELVAAAELAVRQTIPAEVLPEYLKEQQSWANRLLEGKP